MNNKVRILEENDSISGEEAVNAAMNTDRYISFVSDAPNLTVNLNLISKFFLFDRVTKEISSLQDKQVSTSVSCHRRYVAFVSGDNHLAPNNTNSVDDVFVFNREGITPPIIDPAKLALTATINGKHSAKTRPCST